MNLYIHSHKKTRRKDESRRKEKENGKIGVYDSSMVTCIITGISIGCTKNKQIVLNFF
jgi:hypothetical protein